MKRDVKDIEKIIEYCERIEEYIQTYGSDEDDFLSNKVFQGSAFCLIQIGEAVARLSEDVRALDKDVEWNDIKGFRNILVHRYGTVWLVNFWQTIVEDVPILKEACRSMLDRLKASPQE